MDYDELVQRLREWEPGHAACNLMDDAAFAIVQLQAQAEDSESRYQSLQADAEQLRAALAAARALLREAQDVIYDGKPNARGDIELLRRIDAALALHWLYQRMPL